VTKTEFDQIASLDLAKHLDLRIETVLSDYMDRCAECGISYEEATMKAVTVLGHYFTVAAGGIDATEPEIIAACRWHYERMTQNGKRTDPSKPERRRVSQ